MVRVRAGAEVDPSPRLAFCVFVNYEESNICTQKIAWAACHRSRPFGVHPVPGGCNGENCNLGS